MGISTLLFEVGCCGTGNGDGLNLSSFALGTSEGT